MQSTPFTWVQCKRHSLALAISWIMCVDPMQYLKESGKLEAPTASKDHAEDQSTFPHYIVEAETKGENTRFKCLDNYYPVFEKCILKVSGWMCQTSNFVSKEEVDAVIDHFDCHPHSHWRNGSLQPSWIFGDMVDKYHFGWTNGVSSNLNLLYEDGASPTVIHIREFF